MNKFIPVLLLCYICVVAFIVIDVSEANDTKVLHRNRRYLSFLNMTRFYVSIVIELLFWLYAKCKLSRIKVYD
ncbi:hypothetical protein HF086_009872 [Spodoptera exigua]|uniref:Uncharacterized protein n=1 Tax=Spodoptera exigua TaxID=7107 RepID=A0A922M4J7_SPOEX|nr:hypothetical protein HF086_009872 [Spodoptera exigua]